MSWAPEQVEAGLAAMNETLTEVYGKLPKGSCRPGGDRVDWHTGLHALLEKEDAAKAEAAVMVLERAQALLDLDGLPEPLAALIQQKVFLVFSEMVGVWLDWFFEAGPNPLDVMKRMFAWTKHQRPELVWKMGVRDLGKLFGESHGAAAYRLMTLFGEVPAAYQKAAEARRNMASAQKDNKCRLGGRKARQRAA